MNKKMICLAAAVSLFFTTGLVLADDAPKLTDPLGGKTFCAVLTGLSTYVAGLIAVLATIMIIVAGIMFLISAGNPQKTETAKKALIYAIIGIAIALAAGAIIAAVKSIIGGAAGNC